MSGVKLPPGYLPPTREEAMQRAEEAFSAQIIAIDRGLPNGPVEPEREPVVARPFVWKDPKTLPRRSPILGKFWPGFLSATIGAGAIGKSSRIIIDALEIATGRHIFRPARDPKNVWIWNLEDPLVEMDRRVIAACMHHDIAPEELEGRLFLNGRQDRITIAAMRFGVAAIDPDIASQMIEMIQRNKIAVVFIDPLRNAHRIPENDNTWLGAVCDVLIDIANQTGAAIDIAHHPRKGTGDEMTIEDARGGGALGGAIRAGRVVRRMTPEEARMANVEEGRRKYFFRVNDDAKPNLGPGSDEAEWCRLVSVDLDNVGPSGQESDKIGVVVPWKMPKALDGLTVEHLDKLLAAMGDELFPVSPRASDWLGYTLARIIVINPDEDRERLKTILDAYEKAGAITRTERKNPKHAGTQQVYTKGTPP
jgi:hypothetical protein